MLGQENRRRAIAFDLFVFFASAVLSVVEDPVLTPRMP
jgi:hypothetical protein